MTAGIAVVESLPMPEEGEAPSSGTSIPRGKGDAGRGDGFQGQAVHGGCRVWWSEGLRTVPPPLPGRNVEMGCGPRVSLRFTRGYIPSPRWGERRDHSILFHLIDCDFYCLRFLSLVALSAQCSEVGFVVCAAAGDGEYVVHFELGGGVGGWGAAAEGALVVVAFQDFEAEGEGGAGTGAALAGGGAGGEELVAREVAGSVEVVEVAGAARAAPNSDHGGSGKRGMAVEVGGAEGA